jgi:uncharacterized protein YndB with AHSA1/START domain
MKRVKLQLEYIFRASPAILYQFLTTPSCLIRWFCDDVDVELNSFTFIWGETAETAEVIEEVEEELLRLRWEDAESNDEYLEFRITEAPITGETILVLTDFCDEDEVKDQKRYWDTQMQQLQKESGG